jgi:hypothetical protein
MSGLTREYANLILNRVKDDPGSYSVEVVTRALVATGDLRVCPNTEDEPDARRYVSSTHQPEQAT